MRSIYLLYRIITDLNCIHNLQSQIMFPFLL